MKSGVVPRDRSLDQNSVFIRRLDSAILAVVAVVAVFRSLYGAVVDGRGSVGDASCVGVFQGAVWRVDSFPVPRFARSRHFHGHGSTVEKGSAK